SLAESTVVLECVDLYIAAAIVRIEDIAPSSIHAHMTRTATDGVDLVQQFECAGATFDRKGAEPAGRPRITQVEVCAALIEHHECRIPRSNRGCRRGERSCRRI